MPDPPAAAAAQVPHTPRLILPEFGGQSGDR